MYSKIILWSAEHAYQHMTVLANLLYNYASLMDILKNSVSCETNFYAELVETSSATKLMLKSMLTKKTAILQN